MDYRPSDHVATGRRLGGAWLACIVVGAAAWAASPLVGGEQPQSAPLEAQLEMESHQVRATTHAPAGSTAGASAGAAIRAFCARS